MTTKCHRQARKKGNSPDPDAPVLPGVCQARHGMNPPPVKTTHLSRTAVSSSIMDKAVSIPYSSVKHLLHLSEKKRNSSIKYRATLLKFEQSMDQLFNHEKTVRFATFPTRKIKGEKNKIVTPPRMHPPLFPRTKSRWFLC